MKISLYTRISDLIPVKETFLDHVNDFLFSDQKRKMFKIHSLDSIFPPLKKAGVEGLELVIPTHLSEDNIKTIKQISQKYGLKIFSIHQSHDTYLAIDSAEIERMCKVAKTFSASVIVLHINALGKKISEQIFLTKLKNLQKKYDVVFAIENVSKSPFSFAKEVYKGQEFGQAVKISNLAITFDTTHLGQADEDICMFYNKNKNKIVNIHISDYIKNWYNRKLYLTIGTHLALGKGELPILKFLKLLKKENYHGLITMEVNSDLQGLCESARIIKRALEN